MTGKTYLNFEEIVRDAPLYAEVDTKGSTTFLLGVCQDTNKAIDNYCAACGSNSTFRKITGDEGPPGRLSATVARQTHNADYLIRDGAFAVVYQCQRELSHYAYYSFYFAKNKIQKIGQYPSAADTSKPALKRFRSVLDSNLLGDLNRAVGLYAHGIGAGSFVYLRRIFEALIIDERNNAREAGEALENFDSLRLAEKVEALKSRLPSELVAMKGVYSVLSAGIHELSEDICLSLFPAMLSSIELILDSHIEKRNREKNAEDMQKSINDALSVIARAQKN
jgi:hypothetical protein